jgi:hypothetical protein
MVIPEPTVLPLLDLGATTDFCPKLRREDRLGVDQASALTARATIKAEIFMVTIELLGNEEFAAGCWLT